MTLNHALGEIAGAPARRCADDPLRGFWYNEYECSSGSGPRRAPPLDCWSTPMKSLPTLGRGNRPPATEKEHEEKRQKLSLCKEKLSPEDAKVFREIFPRIVEDYHRLVWSRLLGRGIPSDEAEDQVQETFALLYSSILDKGFPENMAAVLCSFADWKVGDYVRVKTRTPISLGLPSSRSEQPPSGLDIDRALDLHGFAEQLLSQLSPEHLGVIEEVFLNERSYDAAAEALNIPQGTLKSRLNAAKRALAALAEPLLPASQRGRK